ncbi:hypothetical protein TVAG_011180 [Trichomonas vaginalis G3]|uniref:Uncharacterized protein n=1 Tax=Trichomonas vaginalis (strain ATCC PRA-98 / G3) TaxID=412133 RepID=A2DP43_TRIV3|nr:hypothetical protein TVAGG3_0989080 [Trichomonas vaginalis G3]EAY17892.1 hypothetical protein TVAG_011180 [Trichomonas vaginalis G3]KAI5489890.1 hypothetical protein TVAGG3_0989080 [Trichomonas vaginalis G3]|eukprot:XP_001330027.1 hypothetical protein [Trichomonas vaginalis G3]
MAFAQVVKPSFSNKNYAIKVSVFKCGENEGKEIGTFSVGYGDVGFENNNITNNKCIECSSLIIQLDGSSGTCNFSNFRENNQTDRNSIVFFTFGHRSLNQTFSYCNVIGNKCGTDNHQVLFYSCYTTNVDHCIFLNNTAQYMFGQYFEVDILTISESYVESNSTTGFGTVTFKNLKDTYDFNTFTDFFKGKCMIDPNLISTNLSFSSKISKTTTVGLFSSKK